MGEGWEWGRGFGRGGRHPVDAANMVGHGWQHAAHERGNPNSLAWHHPPQPDPHLYPPPTPHPSPSPPYPYPCSSHPPPPPSRRWNFNLPAVPTLVAWSKGGPGHQIGPDALQTCSSEQATLLMKKFIRDTWDDPAGAIGSWGEPEHGAWVDPFVSDGMGV